MTERQTAATNDRDEGAADDPFEQDERSIEGNCPTCGRPLDDGTTGDGA